MVALTNRLYAAHSSPRDQHAKIRQSLSGAIGYCRTGVGTGKMRTLFGTILVAAVTVTCAVGMVDGGNSVSERGTTSAWLGVGALESRRHIRDTRYAAHRLRVRGLPRSQARPQGPGAPETALRMSREAAVSVRAVRAWRRERSSTKSTRCAWGSSRTRKTRTRSSSTSSGRSPCARDFPRASRLRVGG